VATVFQTVYVTRIMRLSIRGAEREAGT
jgi:hypothetical protein